MKMSKIASGFRTDVKTVTEALIGPRHARRLHRYYLRNGKSVAAGLNVMAQRWPTVKSVSEASPIFIFSAGWRSGSTLLQRMVMSGDGIFIWGEPYRHAEIIDSIARQVGAFTSEWPWDEFFIDHFDGSELTQEWIANLYPSLEDFMAAHLAFFECVFARPAAARGAARWGIKEIALTMDHALYLRWLFPRAKFVFLYRNPYHAYRSYYKWRSFYRSWPDQPVFTAGGFGRFWAEMTADFVSRYREVDGLLLRYEDLKAPETKQRLETYLDCAIEDPEGLPRIGDIGGRNEQPKWVPKLEYLLLRRKVDRLASELGYTGI